jgi:hypothetical protein
MMTKKKLTKKQKQQMLYNATMIAEGAMDETSEMSYIQAWATPCGHWCRVGTPRFLWTSSTSDAFRGNTDNHAPIKDEDAENNEGEQREAKYIQV